MQGAKTLGSNVAMACTVSGSVARGREQCEVCSLSLKGLTLLLFVSPHRLGARSSLPIISGWACGRRGNNPGILGKGRRGEELFHYQPSPERFGPLFFGEGTGAPLSLPPLPRERSVDPAPGRLTPPQRGSPEGHGEPDRHHHQRDPTILGSKALVEVCPDLWKGRGGAWSFPGLGRSQGREGLGPDSLGDGPCPESLLWRPRVNCSLPRLVWLPSTAPMKGIQQSHKPFPPQPPPWTTDLLRKIQEADHPAPVPGPCVRLDLDQFVLLFDCLDVGHLPMERET